MAVNSTANKSNKIQGYDHTQYERQRKFLRFLLNYVGYPLLAKINTVEGLENFPQEGPAILMINHIAFIDPLVVITSSPRNIVPLAKAEVYKIPFFGIFPRIWNVIPVRREEVDLQTVRQVLGVLKAGEIVLIAPEATRGPQLKRGKEGIAYLASRSQVPVVPVAIEGTEGFPAPRFSAAWKGSGATVKFGKPFKYREQYKRADREQFRKMTDEAMYLLSEMLPPERRGVYSDLENASQETIELIA